MLRILQLSLSEEPDGAWRLALSTRGRKPHQGRIPPETVAAAQARLGDLLRPPSFVSERTLPKTERKEQDAGGALAELVERAGLAQAWGRLLGDGEAVCLAVDAEGLALRRLPWELMALHPGGASLEEETGGLVLRLEEGRSAQAWTTATSLVVRSWCPTPGDTVCAEVLAGVPNALPLLSSLPPEDPGTAEILVLVCHGRQVEEGLLLDLGQAEGGAGTVTGLVASMLPRLRGCLLMVCEGGAPSAWQLEDLAARLLRAGAPVLVSAACPLNPMAAAACTEAFVEAAARGESLVGAMIHGRRAVRALLQPHPDSRPYSLQLRVADLSVLDQGPWVQRIWRPPGWPRVGSELAGLLARMSKTAQDRGHLWVGLEHLWMCQRPSDGGALSQRMLRALGPFDSKLERMLFAGAEPGGAAAQGLITTPRLRALGAALPDGAELDDVWRALAQDEGHGFNLYASRPLPWLVRWETDASLPSEDRSWAAQRSGALARRLEVLWGPEDGRVIELEAGQILGRWHLSNLADVALYAETAAQDVHLSRQALRWLGPGRATVRSARRWPQIEDTARIGDLTLLVGEVWLLSGGTWIRTLA